MNLHTTPDSKQTSDFMDNLNAFRQIEFFSGLPVEVIKLFAYLNRRRTYKAGERIFNQGDDDACSYYLLSGRARLLFKNDDKEHEIREHGPETFFSLLSLMSPIVKQFSLEALEETICIVMDREAFTKVIDQFPEISLKLIQVIGNRVLRSEKTAIQEFEAQDQADLKNILGISLL